MTKIIPVMLFLSIVCGFTMAQTSPGHELAVRKEKPGAFSVQFAPVSFKGWGSMPSTISMQVEYKWLMMGYYHIMGQYTDEFQCPTKANTIGIFYKPDIPLGKLFSISPMVGFFNHRFPTDSGAWWAFGIHATLNVTDRIGFYYQHFSNGGTAKLNPGLDVVGIKFSF